MHCLADISAIIGDADYTVADVEGSLGGTVEYAGAAKMVTPPSLIGTLKNCGVDMLMMANDHALDGGWADLQAAIQNCKNEGMAYVGAAASAEERAMPLIKDINGIKVAFLAYTDTLNGNEKDEDPAAVQYGVPAPAMTSALSYFDGYTTERLPANLLQAQRDYFGAHTYERIDAPRGEFFHTNWTGHGGDTAASTYNA